MNEPKPEENKQIRNIHLFALNLFLIIIFFIGLLLLLTKLSSCQNSYNKGYNHALISNKLHDSSMYDKGYTFALHETNEIMKKQLKSDSLHPGKKVTKLTIIAPDTVVYVLQAKSIK